MLELVLLCIEGNILQGVFKFQPTYVCQCVRAKQQKVI